MSSPPPRDPGGPEKATSKPRLEPGPSTARMEAAGSSNMSRLEPGPSTTRPETAGPSHPRPSSRSSVQASSSGRSSALPLSRGGEKEGRRGGEEREGRSRIFNREKFLPK